MTDKRFNLDELAKASDVPARTIRSWISLKLLPEPGLGRNAGYGQVHFDRVRAIKRLREVGKLGISEIRNRLLSLSGEEIRDLAEGRTPLIPVRAGDPARASVSREGSSSLQRGAGGETPVARAIRLLEPTVGRAVPRKAGHETWHRISVTPEVELSVRDFSDPDQLDRLERLADLLREILSGGTAVNAQPPFTLTAGFDKTTVWEHGKSERYLVVTLHPQTPPPKLTRTPLNLSLVLDVSGSMSGPKLDAVRRASLSIIRALRDCDSLSVVTFASKVRVLLPGRIMDAEGKVIAERAVAALESQGSTYLSGGWIQGMDCVAEQAALRHDASNFVVLLTDGHATHGILDSRQLRILADSHRRRGINTSAVGVGDWSTTQIEAIAGYGGGRLYHAESAEKIVTLVLGEFEEIASVIAEDVMLEVDFPRGLIGFKHVGMFMQRSDDNRLTCTLGSLTSSSAPSVVFRVKTAAGKVGEPLSFTIRAQYRTPGETAPRASPPVKAELVIATGHDNDATAYDSSNAVEAAKAWQAVAVRKALHRNRERRYADAQAGLDKEIKRFSKFVLEKWQLRTAEPLLAEMQKLLKEIGKDMGEGARKVVETRKWKEARKERDPLGRR